MYLSFLSFSFGGGRCQLCWAVSLYVVVDIGVIALADVDAAILFPPLSVSLLPFLCFFSAVKVCVSCAYL